MHDNYCDWRMILSWDLSREGGVARSPYWDSCNYNMYCGLDDGIFTLNCQIMIIAQQLRKSPSHLGNTHWNIWEWKNKTYTLKNFPLNPASQPHDCLPKCYLISGYTCPELFHDFASQHVLTSPLYQKPTMGAFSTFCPPFAGLNNGSWRSLCNRTRSASTLFFTTK